LFSISTPAIYYIYMDSFFFFSVAIFAFIAYKKQSTCIPLCRSVREPDMNVICSWIHIYP